MARPIITRAEMARIESEVGPKTSEDTAYLLKPGSKVKEGLSSFRSAPIVAGPLGCRIIYVGNMTVRERMEAGKLATAGDYILTLPSGTYIETSYRIRVSGLTWEANKPYYKGQKIVSASDSDKVYFCSARGRSGSTEPTWPTVIGNTVVDGAVTWTYLGKAQVFEIIQLADPATYGSMIGVRMACTMAQVVTTNP